MSKLSNIAVVSHLITLLLFVSSSASLSENNKVVHRVKKKEREFDYFKLTYLWPPTLCLNSLSCCPSSACCRSSGAPQHFTIHGLWPDYDDGTWPACCSNDTFDINKISTLREALDKYWPTLGCDPISTCHGSEGQFWAHEWEKHGTCATSVLGEEESNYFQTTLNLYLTNNVTDVLSEARYVPSNSEKYPLEGVQAVIKNAFHTLPEIVCSGDAIEEIRLCFSKYLKPQDCVVTSGSKAEVNVSNSSCPEYVSLPIYNSLGLRNGRTFSQGLPNIQAL